MFSKSYDKLTELFIQKYQVNAFDAIEDLKDFLVLNPSLVNLSGWYGEGAQLLQQWRAELSSISPEVKDHVDSIFSDIDDIVNDKSGLTVITKEDSNTLNAMEGDDQIIISTISGKTVYGGEGNDIIVSGKGNDHLIGGTGRNTYIFSKGSGEDIVNYDNRYTGDEYDKLIFTDVDLEEVIFYQQGSDLVVSFGTDKVTIQGALDESSTKLLGFKFKNDLLALEKILEKPLNNVLLPDNSHRRLARSGLYCRR